MKFPSAIVLLFLASFSGCKTGAESIPELAGNLFDALKAGSEKKMIACIPSTKDMQLGYQLYHSDIYPDKVERDKLALEKAVSMRLSLQLAFRSILQEAREKGIDWKTATLLDLKYNVKDRKEGYKDAKVRMILNTNAGKNVVVFDAMQSEKRWFLVEKMGWEE